MMPVYCGSCHRDFENYGSWNSHKCSGLSRSPNEESDFYNQDNITRLNSRVKKLEDALKEIAKITYGTELINTDEENNAILAPWVFIYQRIAREALKD